MRRAMIIICAGVLLSEVLILEFYIEPLHDVDGNSYWQDDSLRMVSKATHINGPTATVTSLYLKRPFSSLVPDFKGAVQFASNSIIPDLMAVLQSKGQINRENALS